jgi:hypothetical protein
MGCPLWVSTGAKKPLLCRSSQVRSALALAVVPGDALNCIDSVLNGSSRHGDRIPGYSLDWTDRSLFKMEPYKELKFIESAQLSLGLPPGSSGGGDIDMTMVFVDFLRKSAV